MVAGIASLALVVLWLLVGALSGIDGAAWLRSPILLGIAAVGCVTMVVQTGTLMRPRRLPHLALHLGIIVLLTGAAIDAWLEERGELAVPMVPGHAPHLARTESGLLSLPFAVALDRVDVDYYPPACAVARTCRATLRLIDPSGEEPAVLEVNRPARHGAWRIYLTAVSPTWPRVVTLTVRRAPGRSLFVAGACLIMVAAAAGAVRMPKEGHAPR